MTRFIRNLFTRPVRPAAARTIKRPRFALESLEGREVPASISLANGIVSINGDIGNNVAVVSQMGSVIQVHIDAVAANYAAASVQQVNFYGGDGNDSFNNTTALTAVAYGNNGNDSLTGGSGNDILYGGAGDDVLEGRGGNDFLVGEAGNDTYVFSGTGLGSDTIIEPANSGIDTLDFSKFGPLFYAVNNPPAGISVNLGLTSKQVVGGADLSLTLTDAAGIDNVAGSGFDDLITGNALNNSLAGNGGNDRIYGQGGNDYLDGGTGNDDLHGGDGDDVMTGGSGNDVLRGDAGNDAIYGGTGNDTLFGGVGANILFGEDGNDTLVTINGSTSDQLT